MKVMNIYFIVMKYKQKVERVPSINKIYTNEPKLLGIIKTCGAWSCCGKGYMQLSGLGMVSENTG
jgi:NADH:ubiquinone oxidoreductase subunit E